MSKCRVLGLAAALALGGISSIAATDERPPSTAKRAAVDAVDAQAEALTALSDEVWAFAETALREVRSARVLADHAEAEGFHVDRGVADMPTAFVASYGSGEPVIAILGEYDALPGISQKAQPTKEAYEEGGGGHGCGHNLFGAGSLGAAIAVKRQIEAGRLQGTVRFYGTPAEESVGGKLYMVRAGLFEDVDIALAWHPSPFTSADTGSTQAMVDFVVEFRGKAAHAAFDPWNGRSALDGLEIFTFALNQMREHVPPSVRMHYAVIDGGQVPNVVPETAKLWCWLRDSTHEGVDALLERARDIAVGAAKAAGVEAELTVQTGVYEMQPSFAGAAMMHRNMTWLGPIAFDDEEHAFARAIQRATGVPEKGLDISLAPLDLDPDPPRGGSTDVADVSWVVPTLHLSVVTAPAGTPWHAWPVVASGGMSIGHKGMIYAAKTLAATMVDLFEDRDARVAIRAEFDEKTEGFLYQPYIPEGAPPVPAEVREGSR